MTSRARASVRWRFGYPLIWALMLGLGVGIVIWFRRRGWLGGGNL